MGAGTADVQGSSWLRPLGRRFRYRRQIELAVIDMHDRYGAAAYAVAWNSALARGGAEHHRFWSLVARRLRRHALAKSGVMLGERAV